MYPDVPLARARHAPCFDLPLSKVDLVKVPLRGHLFIVLNIKVVLRHGVSRCCGHSWCVRERCRLCRACVCRAGRRTGATGWLLPLSLSIAGPRRHGVRVVDATQLGPWYPLVQPLISAFVVDVGMTVRAAVLEHLNELCHKHG